MTYKELGNTGIKLSDVILGCWAMGNDYFSGQEDLDSTAAINAALENDINTFDTAYCYGRGHSEEVLGKALKGKREDCVVISKLWKTFMEKDAALKACDDSLKRLQTDYMDVYFIHYPSDTGVPIGETMEAMNKMKEQGKIRAIGLSNFSLAQMKEAMQYGQIDVIQPCYSLLWRFIDRDIRSVLKTTSVLSPTVLWLRVCSPVPSKKTLFWKTDVLMRLCSCPSGEKAA